jgi:hypothetical protein
VETVAKATTADYGCGLSVVVVVVVVKAKIGYMTMIGGHKNRKSRNEEMKKLPMLFLNLCTDLDLKKKKKIV